MCTFLSTLPKKSKTTGTNRKRNLSLTIRPCPDTENETTWYRFRLLNFASKTSERDYPFIQRYIHQKWKVNEKGFPEVEDEVVCPVTKWMDWEGNRYDTCPICKYANQQYTALRESNWKDTDARKKNREFGRKYQAVIPVYVVNDPNYAGNNGKFKVIIFSDKKFYDEFVKKIEKQLMKANCFNGVNAVDLCLHMSVQEQIANEGQPNQYIWKQKVIDKIAFSKPYDLPAITKEAVDAFPFDDTYYVGSTRDELEAFYNKYIKISNDDIVMEEDSDVNEVKQYDTPKEEKVVKTNKVQETAVENKSAADAELDEITDADVDDLLADKPAESDSKPEEISPVSMKKDKDEDIDTTDVDELLAGIDID